MWAYRLDAPAHLERVTARDPGPAAAGQVIVRMLAGGICGSDIPKFCGRKAPTEPPDGYPLHEIVAEVVATSHPLCRLGAHVVGLVTRFDGAGGVRAHEW